MRFETTKGVFLTAATQEDAAILAAQYNMGDIARVLPAAPSAKPRRQMSVATAVRIFAAGARMAAVRAKLAMDAQQRAAQAVIAANPGCTDDVF